eukprot:1588464-Rhodomonas_salina.1
MNSAIALRVRYGTDIVEVEYVPTRPLRHAGTDGAYDATSMVLELLRSVVRGRWEARGSDGGYAGRGYDGAESFLADHSGRGARALGRKRPCTGKLLHQPSTGRYYCWALHGTGYALRGTTTSAGHKQACVRELMRENKSIKLVLMSATGDIERYKTFFGAGQVAAIPPRVLCDVRY